VARPGSFGVKPRLSRAEVLQCHQFAVPDWQGSDVALREAREWRKRCRGIAGKNSAISAVAVPEPGRSSASPSRAWARASSGPKPLPTGNRFDRKHARAASRETVRNRKSPDRHRPARRRDRSWQDRNRIRKIRLRRTAGPTRKTADGDGARISGIRAVACDALRQQDANGCGLGEQRGGGSGGCSARRRGEWERHPI